jgi:hypothetical protein
MTIRPFLVLLVIFGAFFVMFGGLFLYLLRGKKVGGYFVFFKGIFVFIASAFLISFH